MSYPKPPQELIDKWIVEYTYKILNGTYLQPNGEQKVDWYSVMEKYGEWVHNNIVVEWKPIGTAPKEPDETGLPPYILLGFAPDEDGYSLPVHEGFWNASLNRWVVSIDPDWGGHGQPTHWKPLPNGPTLNEKIKLTVNGIPYQLTEEQQEQLNQIINSNA